ncbi:DUF6415 family natural product biosynthesis protein [Streptomyces sp. NPDC052773]|uniref:DUF6415 family natural product biosynthesis protein n=1 Tax=Streptomyces sp. NPDC052773 TaxID=3365693 RepID=UPI0037D572E6
MREAACRLLAEDAELPTEDELETLTLQLRGHLMLVIPVVEALAERLPEDDAPRACAYSAVAQARTRLSHRPWPILPRQVQHAQRLARSVNALCDHYENLSSDCPAVLDEQQAALLRWWNHCLVCETCMATDDAGVNANLPCPAAKELHEAYRDARSAGAWG